MEDQQLKSTEDIRQKPLDDTHGTLVENRVPASAVDSQENQSGDMPLPKQNSKEIIAQELLPESVINQQESPAKDTPLPQDRQELPLEEGAATQTLNQGLKSAIESLLFIAGNPLSLDRLKGIFEDAREDQIVEQLNVLMQEYEARGSGIMLVDVAGGYQLVTRPANAVWIRKFRSVKISSKLSRPALETLAIIAYKQPITRTEVEVIRGVNIGGIVRNLMERRLVKIVGKKDVPGKPMLYGTTLEFLQYFGLKDLSSLPTLKEFQELEVGEEIMEDSPAEGENATPSEGAPAAEAEAAETGPVGAAATRENATQ